MPDTERGGSGRNKLAVTTPATLRGKMDAYRLYWASGREQCEHGVFPLVLFLVPDRPRHELVARLIAEQRSDGLRLYDVAVLDEAADARSSSRNRHEGKSLIRSLTIVNVWRDCLDAKGGDDGETHPR